MQSQAVNDPLCDLHTKIQEMMERAMQRYPDRLCSLWEKVEQCTQKELFSLLNLVAQNNYLEDILEGVRRARASGGETLPETVKNLFSIQLPLGYPVPQASSYARTARFQQSLAAILDEVILELRLKPMTRDQFCQATGLDRRRVSSAVSPLCALNFLVEPEALKINFDFVLPDPGQPGQKLIVKQRMPGVRLYRNLRQEAMSCQVSTFIAYLRALRAVRAALERLVADLGGAVRRQDLDLRYLGRRVDELAKKRQ